MFSIFYSPETTSGQKVTNLIKQEGSSSGGTPSSTVQISSSASITSTSSFTASEVSSSTDTRNFSNFHQNDNELKNAQLPNSAHKSKDQIEVEVFDEQKDMSIQEQEFEYFACSVCQNKRPSIRLKRDFNYSELHHATNGFSLTNFLSEGGFGSVYKGVLICGLLQVAVKQHKDASSQGEKEFKSEVDILSKARHPNLVMLLGSCSEETRRLLVYEFVCNGSLDQHLSSKKKSIRP